MLLSANQQMAQALEQAQASYTFETGPGEHDWVFWDEWIQKALAASATKIERKVVFNIYFKVNHLVRQSND